MTTTKIDVPTPVQKDLEREKVAEDIKQYLAEGGKVTECPPRAFTLTDEPKKKFSGSRFDSLTNPYEREVGAYKPTKDQ